MKKNIEQMLDLAIEQVQKDRNLLTEAYEKFSSFIASPQDLAVNGQNVNKTLELLVKQTASLIELAKLNSADKKKKDVVFSDDEKDDLFEELRNAGHQ